MQISEVVSELIQAVYLFCYYILQLLPTSRNLLVERLVLWDFFLHFIQESLALFMQVRFHFSLEICMLCHLISLLLFFSLFLKTLEFVSVVLI